MASSRPDSILVPASGVVRVGQRLRQLRIPWIPVGILSIFIICAIFAPLIAPFDPREPDIWLGVQRLGPLDSSEHLLGVDVLGRDILSRIVYGARISVFISMASLLFGAAVGTTLGVMSGYLGGKIDGLIMRITDAVQGFPTILLALIIVAIQGGAGIQNVIIAIMVTVWADFSRQVRGEVLSLKERDYVTLATVAGVSPQMIMLRHIFPNVINTILIIISLRIGQTILLEASLNFFRRWGASGRAGPGGSWYPRAAITSSTCGGFP